MAFKSNNDGKFIQDTVGKNALAADGNGDDEDQADCSGLKTELANKIKIGKEEIIKSDNDEWIKISKPNKDEEGRDNECQSSTSIKADKKGTENPAINLGILDKSDTDQLTSGTCRSAEDETESNEDEACNSCKNANGQRLNEDTVENLDIGNHPLSDSWDTGSSVDNFSANFQRISGENKKLNENEQHLSTFANKLQEENNKNLAQISRLQEENNKNLAQISRLQEENNKNLAQISRLQEENNKNLAQISRVNEEVNSLQSQVQQLNNQDKQSTVHIQQLQKDLQMKSKKLNSCENENEKFKRENAEFKKSTKQLQDEIKRQKQGNSDLRKHIEAISRKFEEQKSQWEQSSASMNAELERHKIELQNNREEHSNLLTRYSKLAGETLSMGNANVSDLSDPNRPIKLAEQFSELYDNDWTDAFEELSHLDEEERISLLLKILQRAYELSADMAATHWLTQCYYTTNENYVHKGADTCNMVTKGPGNSKESTEKESINRTETVSTSANETLGPGNGEESTEQESNNKAETESTSANETLGPGNGEESTEQESNNRAETESTSANETLGPGNSEESAEKKSSDRAETETASPNETSVVVHVSEAIQQRKLNMLEMPVQKLDLNEREQGAVKVFAHIKKKILSSHSHLLQMVIKECLMKEFEIIAKEDGETTKLLDYVTKCCNICLLMCVKAPPLYINFLTDTTNHEKISFNNEQYKPYTKKGKYIQFLVWPCLFFEKNGPILAKGIAQGR